jgi:hypothetical protein
VKLLNGHTKVPKDEKVLLNKKRSLKYVKGDIDTLSLYWKIVDDDPSVDYVYRFYSNGAINLFTLQTDTSNYRKFFNPAYNGYRGYYYESSGCLKADYFGPVSDSYDMGRITERFEIRGDTLFEISDKYGTVHPFIKRPMPKNIMKYKATW